MNNLPSVKTHPVLMSLITVTFFVAILVAGLVGGWFLRAAMESRAELAVVLDDSNFMQQLEVTTNTLVKDYQQWQESFYRENTDIPDCLSRPLPRYYYDNDAGLQPSREQESY